MGCLVSSADPNRSPPLPLQLLLTSRLFDVYNIDDRGQERSPGKIEVGDEDLVLHQIGKEPIRWPLRSLRRYGFDAELFSFESGRRCPCGPGIYAFKCLRAEALFALLQESIIRAGQMQQEFSSARHHPMSSPQLTVNMPGTPATPAAPAPTASAASSSSSSSPEWISGHGHLSSDRATTAAPGAMASMAANDYVNAGGQTSLTSSSRHHHGRSPCHHNYINRETTEDPSTECQHPTGYATSLINSADLMLPVGQPPEVLSDDNEPEVLTSPSSVRLRSASNDRYFRSTYINLPSPLDGVSGCDPEFDGSRGRQYVNIGSAKAYEQTGTHQQQQQQQQQPVTTDDGCAAAVTYAQLDLIGEERNGGRNWLPCPPGRRSSVEVETSRMKPDAYASIDFQRTRALSSKVEDETDEGHRKTRHNGTIDCSSHPSRRPSLIDGPQSDRLALHHHHSTAHS